MSNFAGIGVSPGVVLGPVRHVIQAKNDKPVPATGAQVFAGLEKVAEDLEHRAMQVELEIAKDVLNAQAMMARDPALHDAVAARLDEDKTYPDVRGSIEESFGGFKDALLSLGGYFAERVADLDEISHRLISKLAGTETDDLVLDKPSIIVAEDLTPADTAALNLKFALALVVAKGGPTSHTAIVARGLGIPAIVGCTGVLDIAEGTEILVDGREGLVITSPSTQDVESRRVREEGLRARAASVAGPGRLSDGNPVSLLGNAGTVDDVIAAANVGAEGIGLFRTELLFLDSQTEPTVEEQINLYSNVFKAMAGRKVVIRTLDAGSDKPVPYINAPHEENPALGVRGWRLTRTSDDVLSRQLEALAKAAQRVESEGVTVDVWVMAPMINTPAEAREFASRAHRHGIKTTGVMVETPAAALHADKVLAEVEFGSFGTNDLTQYVMASDRLDARLSDMTTTWHPAVLRAIAIAAKSANELGKPIGVCGESAANPQLAAVLLGLGVSSLSMAPSALAEVRGFLAHVSTEQCLKAAELALSASSADEARDLAISILGQ